MNKVNLINSLIAIWNKNPGIWMLLAFGTAWTLFPLILMNTTSVLFSGSIYLVIGAGIVCYGIAIKMIITKFMREK